MQWHPENRDNQILGEWNDEDCETLRPYICSMPYKPELTPSSMPNKNKCPEGWTSYNFDCYKFYYQNVTHEVASETCATDGKEFTEYNGHLATLKSIYENFFQVSFFGSDQTNRFPPVFIWLGLIRNEDTLGWENEFHLGKFSKLSTIIFYCVKL